MSTFFATMVRFFESRSPKAKLDAEIARIQQSIAAEKAQIDAREKAALIETEFLVELLLTKKMSKAANVETLKQVTLTRPTTNQVHLFQKYDGYMRHEDKGCIVHCLECTDADSSQCTCTSTTKYTKVKIYDAASKIKKLLRKNVRTKLYRKKLEERAGLVKSCPFVAPDIAGLISMYV
jgi:hypothetical protein